MRQATLAPMAAAPAIPPRKALLDALSRISRKVKGSCLAVVVLMVTDVLVVESVIGCYKAIL